MARGDGPGKSDRIAIIEALKEEEKGIMTMSPGHSVTERISAFVDFHLQAQVY